MGIALVEGASTEKQGDDAAALEAVAKRVFAEAKAKKEEAEFCFFTGKSAGGITDRVRQLCQGGEAGAQPQLFLLDIPDNGGFYAAEVSDVTEKSILKFIEDYKSGSLTRKQME